MYRKEKLGRAILFACAAAAILIGVALIVFFVHTVRLRNEFRMTRIRINEVMCASDLERCTLQCGDETLPLTQPSLTYYNMYLNSPYTLVYNRRRAPQTEQTITLRLQGGTLSLTGLEDGTAVNVCWESGGKTLSYTVRNEAQTFTQLTAYFKTCRSGAGKTE